MQGHTACQLKPTLFRPDQLEFQGATAVAAAFPEGGVAIIFIFLPRGNPVKFTDPDGKASKGKNELKQPGLPTLRQFALTIKFYGKADGANLYLNKTLDGCFARASIIANALRKRGFQVNYAYVTNPIMPGSDERFNYHIAAAVNIEGTTYVVDPLWNWEGIRSGLSKYDDWVNGQDPAGNEIRSGYNAETGMPKESDEMLSFYREYNEDDNLTIPEYATGWLENYAKTDRYDYDGKR
jgi:hypothetical protein